VSNHSALAFALHASLFLTTVVKRCRGCGGCAHWLRFLAPHGIRTAQRIRLIDTSSWRELDAGWRDRLAWLHDDYFFRRQDALWKANALRTLPVRR